jgi:hypothetical protein
MAGRRAKAIERLRLEASRERIESGRNRSSESPCVPVSAIPNACAAPSSAPSVSAAGLATGGRDQFCSRGSLRFRENYFLS